MADGSMANTYDYTFSCEALSGLLPVSSGPSASVIVTHWRGTEGVSRLYRFDVTFAVAQGSLALEKLLNQPATLQATAPDGTPRQWHGIITQAGEQGRDDTHYYYQVALEPRMARLRAMRWSDIYLKRDLADLIKQLLANAGLTEPYSSDNAPYDYRVAATQLSQTQTDFTCQFEETCLDFLMRKLEYYGVYFWFEQGSSQESVVFANGADQQPGSADAAVYYPNGTIDPDASQIAIMQLNRRVGLPASMVVLHDSQELSNTTLTLSSQASVPKPAGIQALGEYHSSDDHFEQLEGSGTVSGSTLATWRAQELACDSQRVQGAARTPGIRAGRFLDVSEYLRGAAPRQYYVIEVTHEGTQTVETAAQTDLESYRADFVALPRWLDPDSPSTPLQFRAPRVTPVPRISQMINGFIDIGSPGAPKRFAQPDSNGCYKVRFLFARQRYDGEQNSAFLRLATPYAGGASSAGLSDAGMHFPLREGTEVLIAFLNGNPDRPVIVSALPNTEAPSVVTAQNSAQHMIGTPGGNTVVLADAAPGGDGAPAVRLYSPVQESSMNLGTSDEAGVDDGFHLKTDLHGEMFAGSSMLIEVPGHYRVAAGTDGSGGALASFLGSEVDSLPSGITAAQSGGIVITNFLGMKIESTEALAMSNYLGVKVDLNEAAVFETTLGFKLGFEAVLAKEVNLIEKTILRDSANYTNALTSWIVGAWQGIAAEKSEEVGEYTITTLGTYTLVTPIATITALDTTLSLTAASAIVESPLINLVATGAVTIASTANTAISAGTTLMDLSDAGIAVSTTSFELAALGDIAMGTAGVATINGSVIMLG
jgi:type VI secretion system VgrG family protein